MNKLALLSAATLTIAVSIVPSVVFAQAPAAPAAPAAAPATPATPATPAPKKMAAKPMHHAAPMHMAHGKSMMHAKTVAAHPAIDATTDQLNQQQLDQAKTK